VLSLVHTVLVRHGVLILTTLPVVYDLVAGRVESEAVAGLAGLFESWL
jgi:hypothetical protein